ADTALSDVDGERGKLVIAGSDVEALAGSTSFETLCARLWRAAERAPRSEEEARAALAQGRVRAWDALSRMGDALSLADGMDALRAACAHLAIDDFARMTGAVATFAAAWGRTRAGERPIAPDPAKTHAADYLHMLGVAADAARASALDAYLVTVSDHGMNAST